MELAGGVSVEKVESVVEQRLMAILLGQRLILGLALIMTRLEELLPRVETCAASGHQAKWICM